MITVQSTLSLILVLEVLTGEDPNPLRIDLFLSFSSLFHDSNNEKNGVGDENQREKRN